jgi:NADH:ubiquinone oxidoreductase subunit 4 (subunit M)
MNFAVLGLFTLNIYGHVGCIFLMLAHGITSTGLFLSIGIIYDRYHTRIVDYYSGLVAVMPLFSIFFFIFFISNIGFPGTANFIAEFLIFLSIGFKSSFILFLTFPSFLLSLLYSVFVFNRVCFGTLSFSNLPSFDITLREFYLLFSLTLFLFLFGLFPQAILNVITVF